MNVKQNIKGVTAKTGANGRKAENEINRPRVDMDSNKSFLENSTAKIA